MLNLLILLAARVMFYTVRVMRVLSDATHERDGGPIGRTAVRIEDRLFRTHRLMALLSPGTCECNPCNPHGLDEQAAYIQWDFSMWEEELASVDPGPLGTW